MLQSSGEQYPVALDHAKLKAVFEKALPALSDASSLALRCHHHALDPSLLHQILCSEDLKSRTEDTESLSVLGPESMPMCGYTSFSLLSHSLLSALMFKMCCLRFQLHW